MLTPRPEEELPERIHPTQPPAQSIPAGKNVIEAQELPYVLVASLAHDPAHPKQALAFIPFAQPAPKLADGNLGVSHKK
jgi:hypothetical protein